jgi:predicted transcriptional regulator
MTTLTLKVPSELAAKLKAVAARKRVPKSQLMREALGTYLSKHKVKPSLYDRMKNGIGCIKSGKGDLSTNPKHLEGYGR